MNKIHLTTLKRLYDYVEVNWVKVDESKVDLLKSKSGGSDFWQRRGRKVRDLIEEIIDHVLAMTYENLDEQTIEAVKRVVIDAMGAAVAGSRAQGIKNLFDLVTDWNGKPEATIIGIWEKGSRFPGGFGQLCDGQGLGYRRRPRGGRRSPEC